MTEEAFAGYWFGCFGVVALLNEGSGGGFEGGEGKGGGIEGMGEDTDWEKKCLGTFYVKPNYPGIFLFSFSFPYLVPCWIAGFTCCIRYLI